MAQGGPVNALGRLRSQLAELVAADDTVAFTLFQPPRVLDEFMPDSGIEIDAPWFVIVRV